MEHLQLHAPSLDDVFLAKTGRSLEGAAEEAEQEGEPRSSGRSPRAAVSHPHRAPAREHRFPVHLSDRTARGHLSRAQRGDQLPGFPTDSFLAFFLAFPFIQGALFATMNVGTDLARDIQIGFLNRLALTPMRGAALIAGRLGGIALLGLVQAVFYLSIGLAFGVRLESGVAGTFVLLALATLIAVSFSALGAFFALRTGSGEAVRGLFPLLFVLLFLSSMNLPRNLIETDWFRTVATFNPVSYLIEGIRA